MTVRVGDRTYSVSAPVPQMAGHPGAPVSDYLSDVMRSSYHYAQRHGTLISHAPGSYATNRYRHHQEIGVVRAQAMTGPTTWGGIGRAYWRMHREAGRIRATAILSVASTTETEVDLRLRLVNRDTATEVNDSMSTRFSDGQFIEGPATNTVTDIRRRVDARAFYALTSIQTRTVEIEVALGDAYGARELLDIRLEARANRMDSTGTLGTPVMLRVHAVVFEAVYADADFDTALSESGGATTLSPAAFAYGNPITVEDLERLRAFQQWAIEKRPETHFSHALGEPAWDDYGGASTNAAAIWNIQVPASPVTFLRRQIWITPEMAQVGEVEIGAECTMGGTEAARVYFDLTGTGGTTTLTVDCAVADNGNEVVSRNNSITGIVSGAEWVDVAVRVGRLSGSGTSFVRQVRLQEEELTGLAIPGDD